MQNYQFTSKHLGFRLYKKEDIDNLATLAADPDVMHFFPGGVRTREQTEARLNDFIKYYEEHGLPGFVIYELATGEFAGRCGFGLTETNETEVGYLLHKKFWGKGYASEALTTLLTWAKENLKIDYIIAFAPTNHIASQRVMEKCGMKYYKTDIAKNVECRFYRIKNQ